MLAPEYANGDRIAVRAEVAIELVRLPNFEWDRPYEIEERPVVQRRGDGRRFRLTLFEHDAALRHDLVAALALAPAFAELLPMPK